MPGESFPSYLEAPCGRFEMAAVRRDADTKKTTTTAGDFGFSRR
jgi:hypothetical protein